MGPHEMPRYMKSVCISKLHCSAELLYKVFHPFGHLLSRFRCADAPDLHCHFVLEMLLALGDHVILLRRDEAGWIFAYESDAFFH